MHCGPSWQLGEHCLPVSTCIWSFQPVTVSTGNPCLEKTTLVPIAETREGFDALVQESQIKHLVKNFRLDTSPVLQRDNHLRKEVIKMLLLFVDVISIGGYGQTSLAQHAINVEPGSHTIKMKHWPLNPVMEKSLRKQIDWWLAQEVNEEARRLPGPQGDPMACGLLKTECHHKKGCLPDAQHCC